MQAKYGWSAKFMPWFDGPYHMVDAHAAKSMYMLNLPNEPNCFPTFHSSLLHPFVDNDPNLFPLRTLPMPDAIVTPDGQEEWLVDRILYECKHSHGYQYLICWQGWGPKEDRWLSGWELVDCAALDVWLGTGFD